MSELRVNTIVNGSNNGPVSFPYGIDGAITATYAPIAGISSATSEWTLSANGSSDYRFTGPGFDGTENDPTLFLLRGQKYRFVNTMGMHPFRIQSTPNGSTGTQYNDGITNNDVSNGTLRWDVQFDAPDILYYQCTAHASMGGKIYILNAGVSPDANVNTSGIITASSFVKSGGTSSQFLKADGTVDSNTYLTSYTETDTLSSVTLRGNTTSTGLNVSGIVTANGGFNIGIQSAGLSVTTGVITALNFIGAGNTFNYNSTTKTIDISIAGGGGGSGSGEFNTGISSSVQIVPLSYETDVFTFPSTSGKRYVIESINVSNVAIGDTSVNIIVSIAGSERAYIAYNVPIVSGGAIELLKQPMVANPSDVIKVWATDYSYVGTSAGTQMYMNYTEYTDTDYFGVGISSVSIATTSTTTVYTSTTYPSVIQSIHLTNSTDSGDYPVSVSITNGVTTTFLVNNLILPRYSTVEILDRPKRIEQDGKIKVKVEQTSTIDVIISGKKISG